MTEFTKGELDFSVLKDTQIPATLFIKHDGDDIDIAVFEKWEADWAKKEMEANAKELVRRWNDYPDLKQQRDDLLAACEMCERARACGQIEKIDKIILKAAIKKAR